MDYHLYSMQRKSTNMIEVGCGSKREMGEMLSSRVRTDKENHYSIYDDAGNFMSSTYSGGANPHSWGLRSNGTSRKRSALKH